MSDVLATAEWFGHLYATLACGIVVFDASGTVIDTNAAAQDILGASPDALHGLVISAALPLPPGPAAMLPNLEHPLLATLRTKRPSRDLALQIVRSDGDTRWLHVDAVPMPAFGGHPEQVVVSFIDVTVRREGEERLRLLESVVVNANDAVVITEAWPFDGSGPIIVYVNDAFTRMTGYAMEDVLGKTPRLLQGPKSDRAVLDMLRAALEGWRSVEVELLNYRKDGTEFCLELSIVPVADAGGYVTHWVSVQRDVTSHRHTDTLRHLAMHDALTDLPNRLLLSEHMELALSAATGHSRPLALLLLDLDHFKEVNDTLGHHAGDGLLRQVADRLGQVLHPSHTMARLGGDEFAVLLPTADVVGAQALAASILATLAPPFLLEDQTFAVSASIGIAAAPTHGTDAATLLRHADVAMYVAKRAHIGCAVYDPNQDEHSLQRFALMSELRRALAADGLQLYYQPKVSIANGTLRGVEALLRWPHPERGMIPPDEFIPLAEQTGLIDPLTRWVLRTALRQTRAWLDLGLSLPVAVNMSARLLHDPRVVDMVLDTLDECGVEPRWLVIEITESAVMADAAGALAILTRLHDRGIRLAIDDFGTGYSSLSYLKRLPVDEIKIDKSFVLQMAADGDDAAIARAIVDLGHNLGMEVVAEGVEDGATLDRLRAMNCDIAQGYYLGRPVAAAGLLRWIETHTAPAIMQAS